MRTLMILLATLAASVAQAQTVEPAAPPPFEVVRLGDSNLSCEALIAEIGTLNQQMAAVQQDLMATSQTMSRDAMASMAPRPGGGLLTGLGGMAAGFVPGGALVMGGIQAVEQEARAASMRNRQTAMADQMQALSDSTALLGPIAQRVDHLSEIARRRSC